MIILKQILISSEFFEIQENIRLREPLRNYIDVKYKTDGEQFQILESEFDDLLQCLLEFKRQKESE